MNSTFYMKVLYHEGLHITIVLSSGVVLEDMMKRCDYAAARGCISSSCLIVSPAETSELVTLSIVRKKDRMP